MKYIAVRNGNERVWKTREVPEERYGGVLKRVLELSFEEDMGRERERERERERDLKPFQ